jgi:hypothetical protein
MRFASLDASYEAVEKLGFHPAFVCDAGMVALPVTVTL